MTQDRVASDYKNCQTGTHKFEEIYRYGNDFEEDVVRWCSVCGSVVVDIDYDGRVNPGQYARLKSPMIVNLIK